MRRPGRSLALAAATLAVFVAAASAQSGGGGGAGEFASVKAVERFDPEGGVPIEGAISTVIVRKAGSGRIVLKGEPPLRGWIRQGRYRVASHWRVCDANCSNLDPPSNRCSAGVRLRRGEHTRIVVRTRADRPCEISFR